MMEEIKITLETLYDLLRNEKKKEDLQRLNETFFLDVVNYLKEKKSLLDDKQSEDDLFAIGEKDKLEYELRSIKKILKEIYEKREKKIIDVALNKSRTRSDVIDASCMLKEEKDFFKQLLVLLDGYREGILASLFKGEIPMFQRPSVVLESEKEKPEVMEKEPTELTKPPIQKNPQPPTQNEDKLKANFTKEKKETLKEPEKKDIEPAMKKIKFTQPLGSFVWKDLKEYGPFNEGEEIEIFAEVADLIIRKEHAVEVK